MEDNIFGALQVKKKQEELVALSSMNHKTERLGLALKEEEMHALIECKDQSLKKYKRVEFGESILQSLIYTFCDSQYISQQNYLESLEKLQDIFYGFKNAAMDRMTDDEVLIFMKEQFEGVCAGDFEYLEGTCMAIFTDAVRGGYDGFKSTGGKGEFSKFDEVKRWDKDLYMQVVKELFWG